MPEKNPDPTKDPEFQKVVQGFLRSRPKPRKLTPKRRQQKGKKAEKQSRT